MISIKVKTIWQGKVGIREKYITQAKQAWEDLSISKGNDVLIIPANQIDKLIVGRSEYPVQDKFSEKSHFLIYFNWKPTTIQKDLFSPF